ncbi:glycoside hydrolase family 19 protein [Leclercia sp. AS011]|uniref:glycoside hydrolase family 19 protein n=1 Tax=Leclercia sp. AS011 TaxID=3081257 RepID=UPI0030194CB0
MKICYPIRNTNGQEFRSLDEVMRLVDDEAHGTWLLGANRLWHGGIHISDVSNPFSALNPDALNTGELVPLQFMADGTVVAYRLNNEYLTAPYCGQQLRYSSSFVLVKSLCKPDPQKEKSWLEFYSLYMHLAPVADYPASPCYKVRDGHSGILLRQYKNGQNGLPEGEPDNGEAEKYPAPVKTKKILKADDRFFSSRTGRFYVTKKGKTTLTTFGLVRLLKNNIPGKEQYWVTLDPELMEPDGEIQGLMPEWMQKAKQKGVFDSVELTGETEEWKVSAGAPVGFMGCTESPGEGSRLVDREWFVHLEVLSTDSRMPGFLANPECVKGDKKSVLASKGKLLFTRQDATGQPVFTPISARLSAQCLLTRGATTPVADESQKWWYKITGSGWLPQSDVEEVNQYDLLKLGFQALEEDCGGDVMDSPYESWVPQSFEAISRSAEQGAGYQYGLVPPFYRDLMAEMDSNCDGKITAEEIRQALAVRDPLVKNVVNRLAVKHHSEWSKGRSTGRWEGFYKDLDTLEVEYCEKWQADLEWMSRVPPFDKDEAVWHFHPMVFLDAIKDVSEYEITVILIEKLLGHTGPWFTGKRGGKFFAENFRKNYSNVFEFDKQNFVNLLNNELMFYGITGPYHKAHFLSQCLHESAHLDTTLEFGSGENYDPGRHKDAIKNGNTAVGDGPKYKGRGLIQLTWKNNYKRFSTFSGVNCLADSDLIASDMSNAIKASCWYWRNNGTIHTKYSAKGDINVLIDNERDNVQLITLAVNGGGNGLSEREGYFSAIKKEWGLT